MDRLEIKTSIKIHKSPQEVFEAIVDPANMTRYFISSSTGYMKDGASLTWKFPEMDLEFPLTVGKIINDKYISFYWDPVMDGEQTLVEITLKRGDDNKTSVMAAEKSKPNNATGIKWLKSNTEGWAHFLACLKAWMEHGINLRR
jgi:uncharacterized protein YndB with AHSA1/START domain